MGKMGTTVALAGAAVGAVAGVTAIACAKRAAGLRPSAPAGTPLTAEGYHAGDDAVERFRALLRVPTISRDDPALVDRTPFEAWVPTLREQFPRVFEVCELTMFDEFGLLMRWPGADSALDPIVLMAHQDVVPTEGQAWDHDPFAAEIHDGEIWARGSLDTKNIAAAIFESMNVLIGEGYVPPRDVWYFSSNGEEVAGPAARQAVAWMREHGIHPYMAVSYTHLTLPTN